MFGRRRSPWQAVFWMPLELISHKETASSNGPYTGALSRELAVCKPGTTFRTAVLFQGYFLAESVIFFIIIFHRGKQKPPPIKL